MFTHLPSRSVFIDSDRYVSDDSLGYWVAHELGHLAANSASESDADKAAREYRKRLKRAHKPDVHLGSTDGSLGPDRDCQSTSPECIFRIGMSRSAVTPMC